MEKIIVGSTSVHKIEAVKEALLRLGIKAEVIGVKTESEINEQPVGFVETHEGAARRVKQLSQNYSQYIRVGIESGIMQWSAVYTVDMAVVAVRTPHPDNNIYIATSPGIRFPHECVMRAAPYFEKETVGTYIAEKFGGDRTDPHTTLTYGRISRKETLIQGIMLAFAQIPNLGTT